MLTQRNKIASAISMRFNGQTLPHLSSITAARVGCQSQCQKVLQKQNASSQNNKMMLSKLF